MNAIIDILKENNLYTFMAVKERLITAISNALAGTEYEGKYGLSGTFTSTDQTISIVVGVLAERQLMNFISSGTGSYNKSGTPGFREYTYGINITGINDEEVKHIAKYLYYKIMDKIPAINYELKVRVHSDLYLQQLTMHNIGEKRMSSQNIFATVAINEYYPPREQEELPSQAESLDVEGYEPPEYSSCAAVRRFRA